MLYRPSGLDLALKKNGDLTALATDPLNGGKTLSLKQIKKKTKNKADKLRKKLMRTIEAVIGRSVSTPRRRKSSRFAFSHIDR